MDNQICFMGHIYFFLNVPRLQGVNSGGVKWSYYCCYQNSGHALTILACQDGSRKPISIYYFFLLPLPTQYGVVAIYIPNVLNKINLLQLLNTE